MSCISFRFYPTLLFYFLDNAETMNSLDITPPVVEADSEVVITRVIAAVRGGRVATGAVRQRTLLVPEASQQ